MLTKLPSPSITQLSPEHPHVALHTSAGESSRRRACPIAITAAAVLVSVVTLTAASATAQSQTSSRRPAASYPDAPSAVSRQLQDVAYLESTDSLADQQQSDPPRTVPQPPATPDGIVAPAKPPTSQDQLKQAEKQRILGVMPAFNSVIGGVAPPLTPGQKFHLMFKSTTDPYIFGFSAFAAGIGQAQNSHKAYGQGAAGYFKRFGASYADTADGNLWGNAILPIVLHEDPRYFRLGSGTTRHRILYAMSTSVICRRDDGSRGPNYANILGNLIAGGISNAYYPEDDRGAGQTFQSAATVTAVGMIGSFLLEFWPDIAHHYATKRQAKLDAAARQSGKSNPAGNPPQ